MPEITRDGLIGQGRCEHVHLKVQLNSFSKSMNLTYIAFTVCHMLSLVAAILTCLIIGTPNPNAPAPIGPRRISFAYRLLRVACITVALMSFVILLPGMLFDYDLVEVSPAVCWTQGLILHTVYLSLHAMIAILALHNWFLIVKWNFEAEQLYERTYWLVIVLLPVGIVTCCVISAGAVSQWFQLPEYGITARPGYCFWNKPYAIRLAGYGIPYFLTTLVGAFFSIWVAISLTRTRFAQREQSRSASTPNGLTKLYKTISKSTLYRTTFFALFYAVVGAMSFVPSLIRYINFAGSDHDNDHRSNLSVSEFSSALGGLGLFLVFGTGEQMRFFIRHVRERMRKQEVKPLV